jgi:3',5'-cyclic-nucleotide phosphodiesterase
MRSITGTSTAAMLAVTATISFANAGPGFDVVTLGARGGIEDGNLTAFMISPAGDGRAVTCDAGSLVNGLRAADEKGALDTVKVPDDSPYTRVGYVLAEQIKGYLISHAHLDHVAGLVIASPDDARKPIYGLPSTLDDIQNSYFNWDAWPNFGTGGEEPRLKKYAMTELAPGKTQALDGTAMQVTAYPLSHGGVESTTFLIESGEDALLCFGDTGPDEVEKSTAIADVWTAVAGLVKEKRLKAVIIEVSYDNSQPDKQLFGHLTPAWLQKSLTGLETAAGAGSLKDLPVVVSHIKYSLKKGQSPQERILSELGAGDTLGIRYIIPEQGEAWRF